MATVHAEKRKLNMVLYVMRYAGSVTQSMHQPQEQIPLQGHRHLETSACLWQLSCWLVCVEVPTSQEMSINPHLVKVKHAFTQSTDQAY